MQAIETKYLPATANRPSRIKAISASGVSATVSYPFDVQEGEAAHWEAAKVLAEKCKWHGCWVAGSTRNGYVFVRQFARSGETPYQVPAATA